MKATKIIVLCYFVCAQASRLADLSNERNMELDPYKINSRVISIPFYKCQNFQDQTTQRANTIYDDPDDIQKQLDNEARDRMKYGKPKTIWVFHFAPHQQAHAAMRNYSFMSKAKMAKKKILKKQTIEVTASINKTKEANDSTEWNYNDQDEWHKRFPECKGYSQSPVDLPFSRFTKINFARQMIFGNYDTLPKNAIVMNNGKTISFRGDWLKKNRPLIYGGAANSRCYLFHSLTIRWPSEHKIGGFLYPLETQALYISSLYDTFDQAVAASKEDKLAFLAVATIFKFSDKTHTGLLEMLRALIVPKYGNKSVHPRSMNFFNPPFKKYVTYHGSLTEPPCSESVLWMIRAKPLTKIIDLLSAVQLNGEPLRSGLRKTQSLNDRRVLLFN